MLREYWEVEEDGTPKELYLLDDEKDSIPANYFPSWGQEVFYKPKIDSSLGKWIETITQEEIEEIKNRPLPKSDMEILQERQALTEAAIDFLIMNGGL